MRFEADRRLRVVALFSGGASGVRYLADHDDNFGRGYDVVGALATDPEAPGIDALRDEGIPVETNDIRAFYDEAGAETGDLEVRESFDARTRELIEPFEPDVVLLSGYMWILTGPVIDAFPTINVHPADLTVEDEDGQRAYVGYDPVSDAIRAGEDETRSTVHLVTSEVDAGPLIVVSRPLAVHRDLVDDLGSFGAEDGLRQYADAHQEWMKWEADGPAIAAALELLGEGRVERDGDRALIDGELGPYDLEIGDTRG